ncbi:MAG: choice-of-anchor L domain-containing protein [Flavobacteriales bacterium]
MRHRTPVPLIPAALCLLFSTSASAQLTVDNTLTPIQLVQNVLLGGGVTASNITFNGVPGNAVNEQIGSFDGSTSIIGLDAGVIMATGSIQVALGPNDAGGSTEGGGNFGDGDPDLEALAGVGTNDAAILEFDFIPTGDSLKFRYVFSSEEYDEYVCGTVNDVFGFFLSGPGIAGPFSDNAINIALVPGTTIPVSINTVNNGTVGTFGTESNCSDLDANWEANSVYYQSNATGNTIQFDGTTVVLTAFALVECGQQYHIKMAIADGGDTAFDSGVFLEAGSFTSTGQVQPTLSNGYGVNGDILLEGCGPYELVFTRLGDLNNSDTVTYVYGGTATGGVDFSPPLPTQMIFEPGVESLSFFLDVPFDADGPETLVINVEQLVACAGVVVETVFTFTIDSPPPLEVTTTDINGVCGQTHTLTPTVTGGMGEYELVWSTGEVGPSITVSPEVTTTYYFTVSDICAVVPVQDSVVVTLPVYQPLEIEVSDDIAVACLGDVDIEVISATGGNGVYTYQWTLNGTVVGNTASITVPNGEADNYIVTVGEGCGTTIQDSVLITTIPLDPIVITTTGDSVVVCAGDTATVGIVNITGGSGVYNRTWSDVDGNTLGAGTFIRVPVNATTPYIISVVDQCGNTGSATVSTVLPQYALLQVALPPDQLICLGDSLALQALVSGGSGYYTIHWMDSIHNDPVRWEAPVEDMRYSVNVIDRCGEEAGTAVDIEVERVVIDIVVTNKGQDDWYLQAASAPYARTWLWDMGDGTRYRDDEVYHSYFDTDDHWATLSIITPNGCLSSDSVLLKPPAQFHFPNAFTPDGDGINDFFLPVGAEITEYQVDVFDRWGELIFSSADTNVPWDGSVNGSDAATTGVYVYKYRVAGLYFAPQEGYGHVTLLRGTTTAP